MKVIAAYLLAVLGGNATPDDAAVKAILSAAGIEADASRISSLVSELKGKDVHEVIAEGKTKLSSVPAIGGGAASAAPAAAAAAAPAAAAGGAPAKKEEPKEEPKEEEEDEDMGFGLFE